MWTNASWRLWRLEQREWRRCTTSGGSAAKSWGAFDSRVSAIRYASWGFHGTWKRLFRVSRRRTIDCPQKTALNIYIYFVFCVQCDVVYILWWTFTIDTPLSLCVCCVFFFARSIPLFFASEILCCRSIMKIKPFSYLFFPGNLTARKNPDLFFHRQAGIPGNYVIIILNHQHFSLHIAAVACIMVSPKTTIVQKGYVYKTTLLVLLYKEIPDFLERWNFRGEIYIYEQGFNKHLSGEPILCVTSGLLGRRPIACMRKVRAFVLFNADMAEARTCLHQPQAVSRTSSNRYT